MVGDFQDEENIYLQDIRVYPRGSRWEKLKIYYLLTEEGQRLLEDTDKWHDKTNLLRECYESRKKERINEVDSFTPHQKGPITV